jgi:hypothetical protein
MDALIAARAEMETITAELKIRKALTSQIPPAAQYQLTAGRRLIDRENSIIPDGPFEIVEIALSNSNLILRIGWNLRH